MNKSRMVAKLWGWSGKIQVTVICVSTSSDKISNWFQLGNSGDVGEVNGKEEKSGAPVVKQSSLEMDLKKEELVQFQRSFNVHTVDGCVSE